MSLPDMIEWANEHPDRAAKFREALQYHPVLPTPFWKKYGGPNDT